MEHCKEDMKGRKVIKDMSLVGAHDSNTIFIDDNPCYVGLSSSNVY